MGNGLASFAVGFGGGYLNAKRQGQLDEERQADRAMRQQEFDARMGEVNDQKNLRMSLADAARPAPANENGATLTMADGIKTVYDSGDVAGSDFRQLRRADEATGNQTLASTQQSIDGARPAPIGLSLALNKSAPAAPTESGTTQPSMVLSDVRTPMAPQKTATMNGKAFGSLADAQTAATTYNAPAAKIERQAAAYETAGRPEKAAQMRSDSLKLAEMAQTVADKAWQRKVSMAMNAAGDTAHDGLAALATESEFGPMAGKKVKAVPSADGKTVVYNLVGEDGTLTPTKISFPNDQNGVIQAGYMMDRAITPEHRMDGVRKDKELERKNSATEAGIETARDKLKLQGEKNASDAEIERLKAAAKVATTEGKPLNDTQSKALLFGSRMRESDKILTQLAAEGTKTSVPGSRGALGGVINALSPEKTQMLDQAKRDFLNAVLRRESGAVIAETEFANAEKQYFAQIGDDPKTLEQKANNRKLALDGILLEVPEKHRNSLQPREMSNAPMAMPKTKADMKPGSIYQTGRGPAKWNGTAFEAQ